MDLTHPPNPPLPISSLRHPQQKEKFQITQPEATNNLNSTYTGLSSPLIQLDVTPTAELLINNQMYTGINGIRR